MRGVESAAWGDRMRRYSTVAQAASRPTFRPSRWSAREARYCMFQTLSRVAVARRRMWARAEGGAPMRVTRGSSDSMRAATSSMKSPGDTRAPSAPIPTVSLPSVTTCEFSQSRWHPAGCRPQSSRATAAVTGGSSRHVRTSGAESRRGREHHSRGGGAPATPPPGPASAVRPVLGC